MALRRSYSRRLRLQQRDVWPILPGSEKTPPGWPGWPEGKQFAFVMVHDVEGIRGVENCRRLMQLECDAGFRSGFFFIPEGYEYRLTPELGQELTRTGFEVGIHDLHHDGKLYSSHQSFLQSAKKINQYIKDWHAVGFRSGFMHHNLDWIHELDILHDGSTFDTDPFEPQPDGAGTIFPYWVARPGVTAAPKAGELPPGYVEMPYTMAQDSTVFTVFQERDINTWKTKLDWIARHGGMALVNAHPDYMAFEGQTGTPRTYPSDLYATLLKYVSSQYGGQYWTATTQEVARYFRDSYLRKRLAPPAV